MDAPVIRVLLVEDVPGDARIVRETLETSPGVRYRVKWAQDLASAREVLQAGGIDVAVTDLGLPDSAGMETVEALALFGVPIVVLTGSAGMASGFEAVTGGAQDYIVKDSIDSDRLSRAIRYAVERYRHYQVERQRAERAEERLRTRARFLAVAEHKLKTPLTAIVGWASLLEEWESLTDEKRALGIDTVVRSAHTLRQQVDQMLKEVRAEVIADELDVRPIEIGSIARSTALEFQETSASHSVTVEAEDPVHAEADASALHQALSHLVDNAIKYSPKGGRVILRVERTVEGPAIGVIDEGPGIPSNLDIFAAFTRGDSDTEGVGLGLHIVRMLAESMEATVSGTRNPAGGSTFTIRLRPVA